MAEELDKKPKFRVNKQRPEQTPPAASAAGTAAPEKKKVVVVKKKTAAPKPEGHASVRVAVKAVPASSAAPSSENLSAKKPSSISELSPPRPNVKQGNLAGRPYGASGARVQNRPNRYQDSGFTGAQARDGAQSRDGFQGRGERPSYQGGRRDSQGGFGA